MFTLASLCRALGRGKKAYLVSMYSNSNGTAELEN